MRVKVISFTNYKLWVDVYEKNDMDFFSYLLLNLIVKKNDNILLDDVRKDLEIADKIAYLFENSFYNLLDNRLIEGNDDYLSCTLDQLKITKLGEECYKNRILYNFVEGIYKEVCVSPVDDSIRPMKEHIDFKKVIVLDKVNSIEDVERIINDNVKIVFPTYKNVRIVIKRMEADSYQDDYEFEDLSSLGVRDNLKFYDCAYKDSLDDGCELSLVSDDISKIDYSSDGYSFTGEIDKVKYGFDYYVVDDVPYIKKIKLK